MKNFLISMVILFACFSARAVTVTFASPPFDKNAFIIDQSRNFIGLIGSETNDPFGTTVNIAYTNIQGTNYFYLYGTITNNTTGASSSATNSPNGTSLNSIPLTAFYIPGTTAYFSNQSLYVGTNNFSGGGGSGGISTLTKDVTASGTGSVAATVVGINGTLMSGLATGILKNTTGTGVPSIAVAADFPTLNQSTTGNANTATTAGFASSANTANTATTAVTASTANALKSATTSVSVSSATAPTSGQVLTATSSTVATWQTISGANGGTLTNAVYTNTGPDTLVVGPTVYLNTNNFGGGSGGINQLTGDVLAGPGSGSVASTLVNIPTSTIMAGSLLDTAISAPSTPASGKGQIYEDATSKNLAIKNDAGTVNHGIQTRTATANQWIRSVADDGSSTISQPAFTDISGTASAAQIPVATTSANGGVKVDGTTITITAGVISSAGGATGANPTATASDTAVNGSASTFMRSDGAPAIQKTSSSQFGLAKVDGTTITASSGIISAIGAGLGVTNVFINPIVATNTGTFYAFSIFGTGTLLSNTNAAQFGFDTNNEALRIQGQYNPATQTHSNVTVYARNFEIPIQQCGATNVTLVAATSQAILFLHPMLNTNYVPVIVSIATTGVPVALAGYSASGMTTNGFLANFTALTLTGRLGWTVTGWTQ